MIEGRHYQNAYVTHDLDRALDRFCAQADVRRTDVFDSSLDAVTSTGPIVMKLRLGFVWVDDLQYEFIEPVGGDVSIFSDALSSSDRLAFHHICMRVGDWSEFRRRVTQQPLPIVFEGMSGALSFLYLDARETLGHYLEFTAMPDRMWSEQGGR